MMNEILENLNHYVAQAVMSYWQTRAIQTDRQVATGRADQGARSAVTGGAQSDRRSDGQRS